MATRDLPANPSLEQLKKQAKSLLKAVRADDPAALSRIKSFFNDPGAMGLQDAQLVIARDHGFSSWRQLKSHLASGAPAGQRALDQLANDFLRHVVVNYGDVDAPNLGPDPRHWQTAADLLETHPAIRGANIYTAAAIGDVEALARHLDTDPNLVNKKGGILNWEPLMYAAYSRLPGVSTLAGANLLIERGADPNAHYLWGGQYRFTALTGVFGEGEAGPEKQPAHPEFEAFARLLLTAGANPNDSQAAYNRMFTEDNRCLEMLLEFGIAKEDKNNWMLREDDKLVPHPQETLHYQLCHAVNSGRMDRIRLLVEHGVDINRQQDGRTPYELALLGDLPDVAQYLLDHGAQKVELRELDVFRLACLNADRDLARSLLKQNPELIAETLKDHPDILEKPIDANQPDALALMIDLGFDVNHMTYRSALHQAAWHGRIDMMQTLIDAGADPTLRDHFYFGPPLGWALQNNQPEAARFLENCEMDIFTAAACGKLDQLERHLDADPPLLETVFFVSRPNKARPWPMDWMTPLAFAIQGGQAEAAAFLLERGADPSLRSPAGETLFDLAKQRPDSGVAELLESALRKP